MPVKDSLLPLCGFHPNFLAKTYFETVIQDALLSIGVKDYNRYSIVLALIAKILILTIGKCFQ